MTETKVVSVKCWVKTNLIGENKRDNEKKEVDIVSIEMILRKSAITRNENCDYTAKREVFVLRWVILQHV